VLHKPNPQKIVGKVWNLCDVLRDDGITCHWTSAISG